MSIVDSPFCERPFWDRPFCERPFCERPFCESPFWERPFCERPFCERPFCERPFCESPRDPVFSSAGFPFGLEQEAAPMSVARPIVRAIRNERIRVSTRGGPERISRPQKILRTEV